MIDGDTFDIGQTRVRLHGIDAPEAAQSCLTEQNVDWSCGQWASAEARKRFEGKRAVCDAITIDQYGRTVARCRIGGADMGAALVSDGIAFAYRKYSTRYVGHEQQAAAQDAGLWSMRVQSPSQFRMLRAAGKTEKPTTAGSCDTKGNISARGEKTYHLPGQKYYARTRISKGKGERWFCSESDARRAGWRKAKV